jgi:excisionase family DNA binding protein
MREKRGYRELIEHLNEMYPNKISISVIEAAKALGVDRRTVLVMIERGKLSAMNVSVSKNKRYIIPITAIAKALAG